MNKQINGDGVGNEEHIGDVLEKCEMLFSYIVYNAILSLQMYAHLQEKLKDEDLLDALRLQCESIVSVEEQASELNQKTEEYKAKIIDSSEFNDIFKLYDELKKLENSSTKIANSILKIKE